MSAPHPPLEPAGLGDDPVAAFRRWFDEARAAGVRMPDATALATADVDGAPSVRWVLMKGVDDAGGFAFYTNLESRKAAELAANPRAALAFHWEPLDRQVRIEGTVAPLPAADSDAYWATRHPASRIAAAVSRQSRPVEGREAMERAYHALEAALPPGSDAPPRPAHWGGYRLEARAIEFWQGQPHRFHDRIRYERSSGAGAAWTIARLWP
jgi:pyridoxamine 5'-phosphate oxidase